MKTYAVRAAALLASVCLAASACGDAVAPLAPDTRAPELSPAAVYSESAADSVPGKYLPTSGNEVPADGGGETATGEPGKYLPTSGNEAPAEEEPGKYLPTSGSETSSGAGAGLSPESGTGGETDGTPAEQQ